MRKDAVLLHGLLDELSAAKLKRGTTAARTAGNRAAVVMQTNRATVIIYIMVAMILVTVLVLTGVMVGRRDSSVSNAVHHLLGRSGQEEPVLPETYPNTRHNAMTIDTVIVLGDQWAAGMGTQDRATQAWTVRLKERYMPHATVVRLAQEGDVTTKTVDTQLDQLAPITSGIRMHDKRIALFIQCGWNDIVAAQDNDSAIDFDAAADRLALLAISVIANLTARAAVSAVYMIDYPDASAGTGYTPIACEPPLSTIYNHPRQAAWHIHALDMWSDALTMACDRHGFAFVPLRETMRHIGSMPVSDVTDVRGRRLGKHEFVLPFTDHCGLMNAVGQSYQADLAGAYVLNERYFQVA